MSNYDKIDENNMIEIMRTFESLFIIEKINGITNIKLNRVFSSVMIYWHDDDEEITIKSENFYSIFLSQFMEKYPEISVILYDGPSTTFSYYDYKIQMKLLSDYYCTETFFSFRVI